MSTDTWKTALDIGSVIARVIGAVIDLAKRAMAGDDQAEARLRRVDAILTPTSPTEEAFQRAEDAAAAKPPR